jgi:hypothetical protein
MQGDGGLRLQGADKVVSFFLLGFGWTAIISKKNTRMLNKDV